MDNVKSFINKFILPEKKIDVDTLRENIRNLREMQTILAEVRKQINQLQAILSKYEELKENDKDILIIDILLKLASLADKEQKIEAALENKTKADIKTCDKYRDLIVSLANFLYKIELNDRDKKLLWKALRRNKKMLKSMDISKKEFDMSIFEAVYEALNYKHSGDNA